MIAELDIAVPGGGVLHAYDAGGPPRAPALLWHHGTPNTGEPPAPLLARARELGLRWVGYDRPGYGGSTPRPGRDIASAAADVRAVLDHLGIERCAAVGHSGGASHALAGAALCPDRVPAAVSIAGLAPRVDGRGDPHPSWDWTAGMGPLGRASLEAAIAGRATKEAHETGAEPAMPDFTAADLEALQGPWSWFGFVAGRGAAAGPGPLVDDDLAHVAPWGFDPGAVTAPVLLVHGEQDRVVPVSHAQRLAALVPRAQLWRCPGDGHLSVMARAEDALGWAAEHLL